MLKVLVTPRDPNPYQGLLYGALARIGCKVAYVGEVTPSRTANLILLPLELIVRRVTGWRVLHVHWVFGFAPTYGGRYVRAAAQLWFGALLLLCRAIGVRIVWTAHNVLPHQTVFADDLAARRWLVRSSAAVVMHDSGTLDTLEELGLHPRRAEVIPHGPLAEGGRAELVRAPGSHGRPLTLLFFGRILAYKGVEELLAALEGLPTDIGVRVVVAGECPDSDLRGRLVALADRAGVPLTLRFGHVPDNEVTALMASADAVVLPYREVTTSGAAMLALGYGRPVIVPDFKAFQGLDAEAVMRYDRTVAGLRGAIEAFASLPSDTLAQAGARAQALAGSPSWSEIAADTYRALETARGQSLLGRFGGLAAIARDEFYRGSMFLLANTVLLAAFGFAFWAVAARLYPAQSIGEFSAINAGTTLLTAVAALGLPNTLTRFLTASPNPRELVRAVLLAVSILGAAVCLVVLTVAGPVIPAALHLDGGGSRRVLITMLVVVSSASGAATAGLVALRRSRSVMTLNLAGSCIRMISLVALASLGDVGLILSYILGALVAAGLAAGLLLHAAAPGATPVGMGRVLRRHASFSLGNYAATVFGILPLGLVPLVVLATRGPRAAGWFAIAFMTAGFLNIIPSTVSQILFAEASRDQHALRPHVLKALRSIGALLTVPLLVVLAGAPEIMLLFGRSYSIAATPSLRLLALGALPMTGTYLIDAILLARDRVRAYLFMNVANAVLVLGLVAHSSGHGLSAVAVGWDQAQVFSLVLGLLTLVLAGIWTPWAGRTAAAAARPGAAPPGAVAPTGGGVGSGRLAFLDGLRGLAALYVVISHAWDTAMPPGVGHARAFTAFLGFGRYAVSLFIVVSGCSLGLTAWRHALHWPGGASAFVRRRVRRIWPPYLAAVACCSLLGATVLSHAQGTLWDGAIPIRPAGVAVHSLLLQDLIWRGPAGSTAFWSIAIEFHIYFFFLGLLIVLRRRGGGWLPVVAALYVLAGAVVALPRAPLSPFVSGIYPSLYALFVLGVVASRFLVRAPADDRGRRAWERALLWLSAAGIVVEAFCRAHFNVLGPLNDLWLGPLLVLLVTRIGAGALPGLAGWLSRPRALWLGQCSYSMYLIHPVVLEAVWRLAVRPLPVPLLTKLAAELTIGTTASIAVARAFYMLIERHFTQPAPRPLPESRATARRLPRVMRYPAAALRAPPVSGVGE